MDCWQHAFCTFLSGMIKCESNGLAPTYLQTTFLPPPPVTLLQTKLATTCVFLTTVHIHPYLHLTKYLPNSIPSDFSIYTVRNNLFTNNILFNYLISLDLRLLLEESIKTWILKCFLIKRIKYCSKNI